MRYGTLVTHVCVFNITQRFDIFKANQKRYNLIRECIYYAPFCHLLQDFCTPLTCLIFERHIVFPKHSYFSIYGIIRTPCCKQFTFLFKSPDFRSHHVMSKRKVTYTLVSACAVNVDLAIITLQSI